MTLFLISTNILEKLYIIRQFKILLPPSPLFLVFPFAFIPRFSITGFLLYMTFEAKKKKCTEAKGFGHHKLQSSAIPPFKLCYFPLATTTTLTVLSLTLFSPIPSPNPEAFFLFPSFSLPA